MVILFIVIIFYSLIKIYRENKFYLLFFSDSVIPQIQLNLLSLHTIQKKKKSIIIVWVMMTGFYVINIT